VLKVANWLSHLELDFDSSVWRHWVREIAASRTFVRYDARGHGLSDSDVADVSFEDYVADLEAVADAAGLERYALLGISMGCATAIAHAIRHPERVSHLVLLGGFAQGFRARGKAREIALAEAITSLAAQGWGKESPIFRQAFTTLFFPDGDSALTREFDRLQRRSATADNAVRTIQAVGDMDVTALLSKVRAPTLVAHCKGDALIPFEEGRKLAGAIAGARFLPLDSRNHLLLEDEPAWECFCRELWKFFEET
jgi:pimeloyl-ACP methyl ester carboxylesterase